jgi:hypothetical protein
MGGRKPVVSDEEILGVFQEADDPVLSAPEVADSLPIGETGTYKRLRKLRDRELLESKNVGQGVAWWLSEEGESFLGDQPEK